MHDSLSLVSKTVPSQFIGKVSHVLGHKTEEVGNVQILSMVSFSSALGFG